VAELGLAFCPDGVGGDAPAQRHNAYRGHLESLV
jgi:hypothetical protein